MSDVKFELKSLIEDCTSHLPRMIPIYTKLNQPVKIIPDDLSEVIHAKLHGTICTGTGGSGWDTKDNGESKCSSHVQSKNCNHCKTKNVFFADSCINCGSTNFEKNRRDGRWIISASSHFKYYDEILEYRLMLVEPVNYEPSCREFRIRNWIINKDSVHLNNYAKAQLESKKSNGMNFQPLKKDFYMARPKLVFDLTLSVLDDRTEVTFHKFNLGCEETVQIPEHFRGLTSESIIAKKNFGKERGNIRRNKGENNA